MKNIAIIIIRNISNNLRVVGYVVAIGITIYLSSLFPLSVIFPIGVLALCAGLFFESYRILKDWKPVVNIFIAIYIFSAFTFLLGTGDSSDDFQNFVAVWPYLFITYYAILFAGLYKEKIAVKLTEGITLLLSISLVYWAFDYGLIHYHNWFSISLIIIGLALTIFSIVHALTHAHLSRTNRLILSIWSTIITFIFSIDYMIGVASMGEVTRYTDFSDQVFVVVLYFFLGVSLVYTMRNFFLLASFLPNRYGDYKSDLKEIKEEHIKYYSNEQVSVFHSFLCIIFVGTLYALNYHFQLLPRYTMIWLVFLFFPLILYVTSRDFWKKNEKF